MATAVQAQKMLLILFHQWKNPSSLLRCLVEPAYPHGAWKQWDAWLLPGVRLWDSSPGVSWHRGAVYNTHKRQRTVPTCHPVFSTTFIYQEIKLGMLGQSSLFRSSLLWNLSWLQVSGTLVLHLIWMTGPAKGILSPDTLQGHWFCMGLERAVSPTESQIPLARAVFLLCVTSNQHSTILTAARKADNIFFQGTKI